jgi:hypothetical protein
MNGQENLVNGLPNWHVVADQKDARHDLAPYYSGISQTRSLFGDRG